MNKLEAVIFDMDGLMVDTEVIWTGLAKQVLLRQNIQLSDRIIVELLGLNSKDCSIRLKKEFGKGFDYDKYESTVNEEFREHVIRNGVSSKKGLFELLAFLERNSIKRTIATLSDTETVKLILETVASQGGKKLIEYFDIRKVVTKEDITNGKPNPEIYLKAAKKLDVNRCNCIAIEDSNHGVKAAFEANLQPIMIPDMAKPSKNIQQMLYMQMCVESLLDVIPILEERCIDDKYMVNKKQLER